MENLQNYQKYTKGLDFTGEVPIVIDFYSPGCGPCQILSPRLDLLAQHYHGRIKVYKVDVNKFPDFSTAANIHSVPTMFFIKRNGDIDRASGALSLEHLKTRVEGILNQ